MKRNWNINQSNTMIIVGIVISVLLIVTIVLFTLFGSKSDKRNVNQNQLDGEHKEETVNGDSVEITAVLLKVDSKAKEITVSDVVTGERLAFLYTGGTKITDKYEQFITVSSLEKGQVVKVNYVTDTKRLIQLSVSNDTWENIGITDVKINKEAKIISYLDKNYSYGTGTVIFSQDKEISIEDVLSMDYLTIRGQQENIHSIVVTSGHGYLELAGEEQFLGGTIYVGSLVVEQITEDLRLTVPEGTHLVTVSNKQTEGSKEVTVVRNQTSICEVQEFGLEAVKTGLVQFKIYPVGASLFVDKERVSFVEPIPLSVGEHRIDVTLGGYVSYQGTLRVDELGTTVSITLHENMAPTTSNENGTEDNPSENTNGTEGDPNGIDNDSNLEDNAAGDSSYENQQPSGDQSDNTSEGNQGIDINTKETITIKWTEGAEVFFNGEYVGVIKDGKLTVDKQIGNITVDLVMEGDDTISYDIIVEDNGEDVVFSFPKR